jgi:PAS domain S-box-containing protein
MSIDPSEALETARRENRALAERVADLERQLKRFENGGPVPAPLGSSLSEREALLSEAERIAHMGSWVWDVVTGEVLWSDELYRIFGRDPATFTPTTETFYADVHPDDRERVREASARNIASGIGETVEYRIVRPNGEVRHVTTNATLLYDQAGQLRRAVGTVLDLTEALESARKVKHTAHLLAEAQRIGKMGSFEVDLVQGRYSWSEEMFRITDVDLGTEPSIELFLERLHEDDRDRIRALVERSTRSGVTQPSRARLVRRDGTVRHLDMMAIPLRDANGRLTAIRGTISDVTELVELEAQFHQSQKMEAVGQLAGGLAHDYNNLLMVISGNAELLLDILDAPEVREILAATQAATTLTNRLLTFSRQSTQQVRIVSLADDIADSKDLIARALGDHIVSTYDLAADAWPVCVGAGQVQQMLLNLALNARDAMPEGGSFVVETRNVSLSDGEAQRRNERPGDYVQLRVTDTGIGMDEVTAKRAFEPFFTTKAPGRGTGLGLAMVFGSMKQCGGFAELRSSPSAGTTFSLWFPRSLPKTVPPAAPVREPPRLNARILLVEDNVSVAAVTRRTLEAAGYVVRVAHDPNEALTIWNAEPADVLVTDVEMPGMSGARLCERIREVTPELRTLFITGHSSEHIDLQDHGGRSVVVMKPFRRDDLVFAVARLLGRA